MPATLTTPITASSEAATVVGMPWSCAAGVKWVHMIPLVDAPQIAKVPASSQNGPVRRAANSTRSARRAASGAGTGLGLNSVAPYGRKATSAGWSRDTVQTSGAVPTAITANVTVAERHSK